jgi:integrase
MQNHTYLVKNRFHTYYYRHITPPDVKNILPQSKNEVRFSLQTKELKNALSKARYHRVQFDLFFELLREIYMDKEVVIELDEVTIACQKEAINLQKFSQQINLLFEKRNKIKNIFKNFSELKGYSLKNISLKNHSDINHFIQIVDKLNDHSLDNHSEYIESIRFVSRKSTQYNPEINTFGSKFAQLKIEKLPIVIKPSILEPFKSANDVKNHVKKEKDDSVIAITKLISEHDIDAEVEQLNTHTDDTQTINLTNVSIDNAQDMQNLLALVNAIKNDDFSLATKMVSNICPSQMVSPLTIKTSKLFEDYLAEKKSHWAPKTYNSNEAILNLFVQAVGDLYVEQITAVQARHWIDVIQRIPANRNKLPQFRDKTVDELLAISESYEPISIQTSKDYLQVSKAAFTWAVQREYLANNILQNMLITSRPKKITKECELRRRFTLDDLNNIFSLPRFTQGDYERTYYCWFPLLGLYTGARAEELAQMELQDIYREKNIWVMNINDNGEKTLKTPNSHRVVPIHKTLIKLGFTKYVEFLKLCFDDNVTCSNKLFPELEKQRDGYSRKPRDRFISFLEQNNLKQPDQAFHSFRHTFADLMKQDDIPEIYCAALLGHKHSNITYGRYGKEFTPDKTQRVINLINPLPPEVIKKIKPFIFPVEFNPNTASSIYNSITDQKKSWSSDKHLKKQFPKIFTRFDNTHDK